jgi:hypothetical protein
MRQWAKRLNNKTRKANLMTAMAASRARQSVRESRPVPHWTTCSQIDAVELCHPAHCRSVYLYYPNITASVLQQLAMSDEQQLAHALSGKLVFLNKTDAEYYARFMGDDFAIFQLSVPEQYIVCDGQSLSMHSDRIAQHDIHGCIYN